jgi:hypothetical protein
LKWAIFHLKWGRSDQLFRAILDPRDTLFEMSGSADGKIMSGVHVNCHWLAGGRREAERR